MRCDNLHDPPLKWDYNCTLSISLSYGGPALLGIGFRFPLGVPVFGSILYLILCGIFHDIYFITLYQTVYLVARGQAPDEKTEQPEP